MRACGASTLNMVSLSDKVACHLPYAFAVGVRYAPKNVFKRQVHYFKYPEDIFFGQFPVRAVDED